MSEQYIWVRSTLPPQPDGGHKVVLYEVDERHPDGEVFLAGPVPTQVAHTREVELRLRGGELERLEAPEAKKALQAHEQQREERRLAARQALQFGTPAVPAQVQVERLPSGEEGADQTDGAKASEHQSAAKGK